MLKNPTGSVAVNSIVEDWQTHVYIPIRISMLQVPSSIIRLSPASRYLQLFAYISRMQSIDGIYGLRCFEVATARDRRCLWDFLNL